MKLLQKLVPLSAIASIASSLCTHAAITGQWDFKKGDLSATIGQPINFIDQDTQDGTAFGFTAGFGIPNIGGQSVPVMKFPATISTSGGFDVPTGAAPNGDGTQVNQWTVVMDVYFPPGSDSLMRGLLQTDFTGIPDFYINAANQLGFDGGSFGGAVTTNSWHRLAFTVNTAGTITSFLDGVKINSQNTPGGTDGRFSLGADFYLFNGDVGQTALGYISSLQVRDEVLADGLIAALGGAAPGGILTGPPPNPYIVSLAPSPESARVPGRSTVSPLPTVEIVVADGVSKVVASSIQLKIDGTAVTPVVNKTGSNTDISYTYTNFLAGESIHSVVLTYVDDATPANTLGAQFQFAVGDYIALPAAAALPLASASTPGFEFNIVQAPDGDQNNINNVLNNYVRAIEQLDGTLTDTNGVVFANSANPGPNPDGSFSIDDVISFNLNAAPLKKFPDFLVSEFPGMPGTDPITGGNNTDNFADETLTYLALTAGIHVFGVDVAIDRTDFGFGGDNGYVLSSGINPRDQFSTVVGQFQRTGDNFNDRENTNEFTFLAPVTGVYPFRLVHWKNFSGATLAWYSVDPTNGQRILINDPSDARSIKAYRVSTVAREPYVAEVSPLPGGQGVAANTPIFAVLGNDDKAVNRSSIKLFLNGTQVTPVISTNGDFTTVLYNPNASRTSATNNMRLVYSDSDASPKSFTNDWSFTIVVSGSSEAQVTGQWDFNGNLTATIGKDLKYFDGASGESVANTVFGTTTSFGIPDIGGVPATVMLRKTGGNSKNIGYIMDHQIAPNGGGQLVNQYTILFDIYKAGGTTTLFNSQNTNNTTDGSIFWQNNDIGQGSGGYVTKGTATSGVWHRIALAADMGATPPVITKFVDGIKQQDWIQPGLDLPRRSWQHTVLLLADGDGDDMTDTYVSSVQVRNGKLSDAQLAVLGKPTAAKIPQSIPETHVTGQWDFQFGDLSATVGKDLQYFDGPAGESVANTVYGTTSALSVPEIDGSDRKIMLRKLGGNSRNIGYIMDHLIAPNGGGQLVNQYTIIFDTYKAGGTATLFNCQNTNNTTDGSIFWQGNDIGQGAGGYVSKGTATSGVWHRIALAADMGANPPVITKFVDGIKQQDWVQPGKDLPRRSWQHTVLLLADGDGDDVTDTYVSSIQVSSVKMTDAQLVALGKPTGSGIPVATPVTTVTGQWDFDAGDLSATIGKDLLYFDGTSGESVANTTYGTTTELGVPDIDGTPAHIMLRKTGGNSKNIGYIMDHQIPPNGGGQLVNQYTIIFDIYKNGGTTTLFNCQNTNNTTDGSIFWQGNDIGQGAGGYVSLGTATSGVWHRIALAADMAANPPVITKFVDGIKQDNWVQPGKDLPRRSWQHTVLLIADGDGDDMTDTYINSIQVRSTKLSDAELIALGGPSAAGIPVVAQSAVVEEPPVSLTITLSAGNVTISWPAASTGYLLETTPSLGTPVWTTVAGVVNNSVTFPAAGTSQFYRLRK